MIRGTRETKQYINRQGQKLGKDFKKELIKRTRALSVKMQKDLSDSVDKGGVAFTNRALLFTYKQTPSKVTCTILVKDVQANYLREIISTPKYISKLIPTSNARLNRLGNLAGLRANLKSGRFKIVKKGGTERLIDTRQKKRDKRIIARKVSKKRQEIYDFYEQGEKGMRAIIAGTRGYFTIRKS